MDWQIAMTAFRITKYNPQNRNAAGHYLDKKEWTGVSEVGKLCGGRRLTVSEYLFTENAYVSAVNELLMLAKIDTLRVVESENYKNCFDYLPQELVASSREYKHLIQEGCLLHGQSIEVGVRSTLRGLLWCKLIGDHGFYVHFGYDYYMYVGFEGDDLANWEPPQGMYCEEFASPYA